MVSTQRMVPFLGVQWQIQQADAGSSAVDDIVAVKRVIAESPACKAGVREGDIIQSVDGTPLCAHNTLTALITSKQPGAVVSLELMRANKRIHVKVTLGTREAPVFKFRPIERVQSKTELPVETVDTRRGDDFRR